MANNTIRRSWNMYSMVNIEDLRGSAFQAEDGGHTFEITGIDANGNVVALSGTVAAVFLRADNTDVAISGSVSGGKVYVTLTDECYGYPGRFGLTIFLTSGGQKVAIYAAIGSVHRTSSGAVSPETAQDVVDLINEIEAAIAQIPASYTDIMAAVAQTYSSTALYTVGSFAWQEGKLYRCIVPITTAESWTAEHWTLASIGTDTTEIRHDLDDLTNDVKENEASTAYAMNNPFTMADYDLEYGYVDNTTGEIVSSNLNIVMKNILRFGRWTTFYMASGYIATLCKYNNDLSFDSISYVSGGQSVTLTEDTFIRISMRTEPASVISDKETTAGNLTIYAVSAFSHEEKLNSLGNACELEEKDFTIVKPLYKQGFISDQGSELFNLKNMITLDTLFMPSGSKVFADGVTVGALHFFDNEGTWQSYYGVAANTQYTFTEDAYVRIGMHFADLHDFTNPAVPNQHLTIYKRNTYNRSNIMMQNFQGKTAKIKQTWEYGFINQGAEVYGAKLNIKTVGMFTVGPGSSISVPEGIRLSIHYYDDSGAWLSYEYGDGPYTKVFSAEKNIVLSARYTDPADIEPISAVSELVDINLLLQNSADAIVNYWKGKKIVWFGTSIPAGVVNTGGTNGNGAYPTRIGEMLGATVYNESVGMSEVRAGTHGSYVTADDPMGYGGVSAPGLMLSLSLSSSEKQAIYDNWDNKWKDIITWYSDMLDMSKINDYKNASWDVKLAKYLTGGSVGPCDLYVFDHGYNDTARDEGYTELDDIPADPQDRKYWFGAMAFLFGKIYADNPKARIVLIGHYATNQRSGNFFTKYLCDAQQALADYWSIPIIKTWEYMGFSFMSITVNNETIIPALSWMPDGIHPASDPTGKSLQHYAQVLYPFVKDIK